MTTRRQVLKWGAASVASAIIPAIVSAKATKLLLVHGRNQQGQDPGLLKQAWLEALTRGARAAGKVLPSGLDVAFPYYGDTLDAFTRDIPLTSQVRTRGDASQDEFLVFQAQVAEEVRQRAGVTDADVDAEYGANQRPRGPLNWEWVQAILRAIDKRPGLSQATLELVTRDVFLYTNRAGVRDDINGIVTRSLTTEPTVVVGHSLGSVVAYEVLRSDSRSLQIPLFLTVGSPLGVRAIRDQFRPLRSPGAAHAWYNAFDDRDVVALYPLDATNFPVQPAIVNNGHVSNSTSNRHGISGYLDDVNVAGRILDALG